MNILRVTIARNVTAAQHAVVFAEINVAEELLCHHRYCLATAESEENREAFRRLIQRQQEELVKLWEKETPYRERLEAANECVNASGSDRTLRVSLPGDIHELLVSFGAKSEGDTLVLTVPEAKAWIKYLEGPGRFGGDGNYRDGGFDAITFLIRALNEDQHQA